MSQILIPYAYYNADIVSKDTEYNGPFHCIECSQELIHKKGQIRQKHFAHKNIDKKY